MVGLLSRSRPLNRRTLAYGPVTVNDNFSTGCVPYSCASDDPRRSPTIPPTIMKEAMFEKVEARPSLVDGELAILKFWDEVDAFGKLREKLAGKPKWSFLDGPITANNPMGVHHAWGRTYKDAFQRFFAMTGHDQRFQNGFDCQGLWVEVNVERELGFDSKRDIEKFGLERFILACKERVHRFAEVQTRQSIRLGMWMDWENSYYTMSDENNYTIWTFLKRCHERGLIYKGMDSMPWCPRCGTGISEQERKEGYRKVVDPAVFVRFPLKDRQNESLLVWTTTPWTLAANVAAAVNPALTYLKVRQGDETYYFSKGRADVLKSEKKSRGEPEVLAEIKGADMIGWTYEGPFDELAAVQPAVGDHRVIAWDEVSDTSGTGIVHIAPGCGKEDFELGREFGLPIIAPIDESGLYVEGFGEFTGRSASNVSDDIFKALRDKGLYYKSERYEHDYPHCWRCGTALLFRAVDEWYIAMTWRDEIKEVVRQINWIPDYGEDLELDWLKNMGDWMISKKRYWGLALPIFECTSCDAFDVIGSREELQERAVAGWDEFVGDPSSPHSPHRPWVDNVKISCTKCGGVASRIPEVGNPWLDAGIVPYSTTGYNRDRQAWSEWVPADFVVESFPGQFRNWFYALLAMSTMMENIAPFKTLLGYASVRDEHGEEMHKSKGNSIDFDEAAAKVSVDGMRWLYCRQNPVHNLNFGFGPVEQLERKVFGTLWNTYLFFTNYAILDEFDPSDEPVDVSERPEIDRWLISNLNLLIRSARKNMEQYTPAPFVRETESFIEELSNWYIRRNRRRFWDPKGSNAHDKSAAYQTLYETLTTLTLLIAPIAPFLAERIYQNLVVAVDPAAPSSVHLRDYPVVDEALIDEKLSFEMRAVQAVKAEAHALREQFSQRVRQPLAELRVVAGSTQAEAIDRFTALLADELNVKNVVVVETLGDLTTMVAKPNYASLGPRFGKDAGTVAKLVGSLSDSQVRRLQLGESISVEQEGKTLEVVPEDVSVHVETHSGWAVGEVSGMQVALDVSLNDELIAEGVARDIVRHVQQMRSDMDLDIEDHIQIGVWSKDPTVGSAIDKWKDYIAGETQADSLRGEALGVSGSSTKEVMLEAGPVNLQVVKAV